MKKTYKKQAFSLIEISIVLLIIGILVAGIISGKEMISEARIKAAQAASKRSPINKIPDLAVWLDSSAENAFKTSSKDNPTICNDIFDSTSLAYADPIGDKIDAIKLVNHNEIEDGDLICAWQDINPQSIQKVSFYPVKSQAGVAQAQNIVKYVSDDGISGLPSVSFEGKNGLVGKYIRKSSGSIRFDNIPATDLSQNNEITIFLVSISDDVVGTVLPSPVATTATAKVFNYNNRIMINIKKTTPTSGSSTYQHSSLSTSQNIVIKKPILTTIVKNTSNIYLYTSNNSGSNTASTTSSIDRDSFLTLGYDNIVSPFSQYFKGKISELVIFKRAISEKERKQVQDYLVQKYKLNK
jgi:prepilin-type N-terminal cleavage/methylation domain-containing protein